VDPAVGADLSEVIPLALVIALSPLSIIPAVLVLQSRRPRPVGLSFAAGWVLGLTAMTALFVGLSELFVGVRADPPPWAAWVRVVIGATLIIWGVYRWFTRDNKRHDIPGTRHLTEAGPGKALALGIAITVFNPKALFICAAAGLTIGSAALGDGLLIAATAFIAISASTVALPILAYAISGDRLEPALKRLKRWMEEHTDALMSAILVIIGLMLLYKGIHALYA